MSAWLGQLFDRIVMEFHVGDRKDMDVKKRMREGFSGAEVYLIELKGNSAIKGYYYLKIDREADEYENQQKPFCFSKAVKCVEQRKIGEFYIMLLQIAGNSILEYQKFSSIYSSGKKTEAARRLVGEMLAEATDGRAIIGEELCPVRICQMQLRNKLAPDRMLPAFLTLHLREHAVQEISAIQVGNDIFPNAFAYAINDKLWDGKRVKNMVCSIHGDLHGGNVFVSERTCEYALIDLAYYREDGWLFFDSAYLEFHLMLHNLIKEPIENWLFCVRQVAGQLWEEVDFKDSKVIRIISKEENAWMEQKAAYRFSYLDQLRMARLFARFLAGLNYAGKKDIPENKRLRAYLFACCYLKQLLQTEGICYMSSQIGLWS